MTSNEAIVFASKHRDHDLEDRFYSYLESLEVNDAQNAALIVLDILRQKEEKEGSDEEDV